MQRVGETVAQILREMCGHAQPGMTTAELDQIGAREMKRRGARSAPRAMYGFPGHTCISVNQEIVHGIPGGRRLKPGDVVKIDVTAEQDGYVADAARTMILEPCSSEVERLRRCAVMALDEALLAARAGARFSAIGRAVERRARRDGFAVIRELCGHGVGRAIHEEPSVPNYDSPLARTILTDGLVIAVEPMLAMRPTRAVEMPDGWTIRTADGSVAVHEEHTVIVSGERPIVLTAS